MDESRIPREEGLTLWKHTIMNAPDEKRVRPGITVYVLLAGVLGVVVLLLLKPGSGRPPAPPVAGPAAAATAEETKTDPPEMAEAKMPAAPPESLLNWPTANLAAKYGITINSVRLSAGGRAIDVRYQVSNLEKANLLATNPQTTYILNESTGKNLSQQTPFQPLVPQEMSTGRAYSVLMPNRGGAVKAGHTVALVVGGVRSPGFVAQ